MKKSPKDSKLVTISLFIILSFLLFVFADDINPDVTIDYPTNTSYNTSSLDLNWTLVEANSSWCGYSLDGGSNNSIIYSPNSPSNLENYQNTTSLTGVEEIFVLGDFSYIISSTRDSLVILNITNKSNPYQISENLQSAFYDQVSAIYVKGDYAYTVGPIRNEFVVTNVTNKSKPVVIDSFIEIPELGGASSIDVSGNYAYVTSSTNDSLSIINITNNTDTSLVSSLSNGSSLDGAYEVKIDGNYAYIISNNNHSLTVINVTDVTSPEQVGYYSNSTLWLGAIPTLSDMVELGIKGNYAYIFTNYDVGGGRFDTIRVNVINITDVTNLNLILSINNLPYDAGTNWRSVKPFLFGDDIYIPYKNSGSPGNNALVIYNIFNITTFNKVTELINIINDDDNHVIDTKVVGDYLYFFESSGNGLDGFKIINVTKQPQNTTITSLSDGGHDVTIFCNDTSNNINVTNVSFTVDTINPTLSIDYPIDYQGFNTNTGINVNFTRSDATLDTCWWSNVSGTVNITLSDASADNITVGESGDGTYTVDVWCNDSVDHVVSDSINYVISLDAPAITLEYPTNNLWLNNGTLINFNVTATDSNGLDSCDLWGNWSGNWAYNQTNNSGLTSGTEHNLTNNLQDGLFIYNFNCTDSGGNDGWAGINFTFGVDTTFPVVENIVTSTTAGSQTFTFNHDLIETNQDSCWFSIYNSSGDIDGNNENLSVNCGQSGKSATATDYGTFNLTIYANDSAGNENSTTESLTLSQSTSPGGGGGAGEVQTVTVVAIKRPPGYEGLLSSIDRARIYAILKEFFHEEPEARPLALVTSEEKTFMLNELKGVDLDITSEEFDLFLAFFLDSEFDEIEVRLEDAEKYDLYKATLLVIGEPFEVFPIRLDRFWLIWNDRSLTDIVRSNKIITNCEVVEGEIGWDCNAQNSSAELEYILPLFPPTFNSKLITASVSYTSEEGDVFFQDVNIRAFSKHFLISLIIVLFTLGIPSFIYRKRIKIESKRIFKKYVK